jgi:hypothetical protein
VTLLEAPLSPPLFRRRCLTSGVCVQLFQIVPLQALGVGPEVSNNMSKCPSLSPPESWKRCACEARQAQVLYGTRDVWFFYADECAFVDGNACWLLACVAIPCSCPKQKNWLDNSEYA